MSIRRRALGIAAGALGVAGATASAVAYQRVHAQVGTDQPRPRPSALGRRPLGPPQPGPLESDPPASDPPERGATRRGEPGDDGDPNLLFGGEHDAADGERFGSLRGHVLNVVTDDGIDLHVEVDEPDPDRAENTDLTVVLAHGFTLNQDSWHFQREHLRGRVRTVLFDQRSHGRSARSEPDHCTIEQLGRDLARVVETAAPGPVVVIGHSMGGMAVISMATQFPELLGPKVVGIGLVATTAGGLDPGRILFPLAPLGAVGASAVNRAVRLLDRGHGLVDRIRAANLGFARRVTDRYSFGDTVPASWAEFVFDMIDATPFEVIAAFYPAFAGLDHFEDLGALTTVPVTVVGGTEDRLTGIGHQRKLHARIPGSVLHEAHGAGHMVLMERHDDVNRELDLLISRAGGLARHNGRSRRPGRVG